MTIRSDKLILEKKNVYGRTLVYPACNNSHNLVILTGRKTFDEKDLETLRLVGFELIIRETV